MQKSCCCCCCFLQKSWPTFVWLTVTLVTASSVQALEITLTTSNDSVTDIRAGSNITLTCSTTKQEDMKEIKWLKNGHAITNGTVITEPKNSTFVLFSVLKLSNVSTRDTNGMYECLSWTRNSTKVTAFYNLTVDGELRVCNH